MRNNEEKCDFCKRELIATNSIDYKIVLKNEEMSSKGGPVTDMMIYPPFENDLDFCGFGFLGDD